MGIVAYQCLGLLAPYIDMETFSGVFAQGAGAGIAGIIAGVAVLVLIGNKEIKELAVALRGRIGTARPVVSEQGEL
jgi:hypothetical protein